MSYIQHEKLRYLTIILFIILFSWVSFFPKPIHDRYTTWVRIFLGLFLLVFILNDKYRKYIFSFRDWSLWLFLMCLVSGTISGIDKAIVWRTYFYLTIIFFSIFYIGKGLYSDIKNRNIINLIICICSSLVALIGLLELYFKKNILYENLIPNPFYERYISFRCMSTQLNPAVLGSFLLGCLPFNLYFLKSSSFLLKILGISSSILCITIIIQTFSRGVFLGLIILLLFYLRKRQKKIFLLFISCLVLLIIICSYQKDPNLNRFGFNRFIFGSYDSIFSEYRLTRLIMTLRILKDEPFFGVGFGHFRIRFNEYCNERDKGEKFEFMVADNIYLTFLAETGLIGTVAFFIFIILLFKNGLKKIKELKDKDKEQMIFIPVSALVGLLVNIGGYDLFYWDNPYMLFCLICGFIQGVIENTKLKRYED